MHQEQWAEDTQAARWSELQYIFIIVYCIRVDDWLQQGALAEALTQAPRLCANDFMTGTWREMAG